LATRQRTTTNGEFFAFVAKPICGGGGGADKTTGDVWRLSSPQRLRDRMGGGKGETTTVWAEPRAAAKAIISPPIGGYTGFMGEKGETTGEF
jgi:hypothetical protein